MDGCTLLVASTGGHLTELYALRDRIVGLGPVEWVTFDTPQARDLLAGETVHLVPHVAPKDLRGAISNMPFAHRLITERRVQRVVSTGAGVAVPYLLTARRLGIPAHYVESAARVTRPSLTGSMVSRIPGVNLYTQHVWHEPGWSLRGSVFDGYVATGTVPPARLDRIVVTLGTQAGYPFRAAAEKLSEAIRAIAGSSAEVLWQTGDSDVSGLDIDGRAAVPYAEMQRAIASADLVISHAGVGSAMMTLETGKIPVLIPRRRHRGEHTDDHQVQLAGALAGRGLAMHVEVDDISPETLTAGMNRTALQTGIGLGDIHLLAEPERTGRSLRRTRTTAAPSVVVPLQRRAEGAPTAPALAFSRGVNVAPTTEPVERPGRMTVRMPQQRRPQLRVLEGGLAEGTSEDLVSS